MHRIIIPIAAGVGLYFVWRHFTARGREGATPFGLAPSNYNPFGSLPKPTTQIGPKQDPKVSEQLTNPNIPKAALCRIPTERERLALYPWLQPGEVWRNRLGYEVRAGQPSPYPTDDRSVAEPQYVRCPG